MERHRAGDRDALDAGAVVHQYPGPSERRGDVSPAALCTCGTGSSVHPSCGLPERGWHSLRHSFGTHAALLGVNAWRLQAWMGHGRIDETMLYVVVAANRHRPMPPELRAVS